MADLSEDPIINAVHNGIKRGIRVALENECLDSAVILILCGIDAMAYIGMPANQKDVKDADFVKWAERYIKFPCREQLTGWDLYGARCAMLHTYGIASRLSRQGKCRQIGYMSRAIPEVGYNPAVSKELVMVSVPALAEAFFQGVNRFLIDIFDDKNKAPIAEGRLRRLVQAVPFEKKGEAV